LVNYNDLTVLPNPGIMLNKGNHPQMAARFRLVKYYNLPRSMNSVPPIILGEVMRLGKLCTQLDEVMIIEAQNSGSRVGSVGMGKPWENHGENRRRAGGKP
jgi:hypothetical protein